MSLDEIQQNLLSGQRIFNKIKVDIKSTKADQYYAEITHPQYNFIISNYHPQSGLNLWSDNTFTGTLNQIVEKVSVYLKNELSH